MSADTPTRARMLKKAAELFQTQGFHGSGLKQILEESGAPRGSLYFHFPGGKEQLAAEAVHAAGERTARAVEAILTAESDPAAAIRNFIQAMTGILLASEFRQGCPIATITLEAAASSETIRQACAASYARWQALIAARLEQAGVVPDRARALALLILAAIEGALILGRAQRDTAPLDALAGELERMIRAELSGPAAGGR